MNRPVFKDLKPISNKAVIEISDHISHEKKCRAWLAGNPPDLHIKHAIQIEVRRGVRHRRCILTSLCAKLGEYRRLEIESAIIIALKP